MPNILLTILQTIRVSPNCHCRKRLLSGIRIPILQSFHLSEVPAEAQPAGLFSEKLISKIAAHSFPGYFEGKWLIVEFMRGWIMTVTMDDQGNYKSMERFLPMEDFSSAIDMKFGPDGDFICAQVWVGLVPG